MLDCKFIFRYIFKIVILYIPQIFIRCHTEVLPAMIEVFRKDFMRRVVVIYLPSATKLRRLCFYRRLSVHGGGGGGGVSASVHARIPHPQKQTPPPKQTPPQSRQPPKADTPQSRHPPEADTPPRADTPRADNPQEQTPPPKADTPQRADIPPKSRHPPEIWPLLRTVHILLECILVYVVFRWFKFTLKPPYSITHGKL